MRHIRESHLTHHQDYDKQGNIVKRLACRQPDPALSVELTNGKKIEIHPVVLFCADNPHRNPCLLGEGGIPSSAVTTSVPKGECEAQRELGICPLKLEQLEERS